jgi:hypothetical protein
MGRTIGVSFPVEGGVASSPYVQSNSLIPIERVLGAFPTKVKEAERETSHSRSLPVSILLEVLPLRPLYNFMARSMVRHRVTFLVNIAFTWYFLLPDFTN